jgi:hypothetical protein
MAADEPVKGRDGRTMSPASLANLKPGAGRWREGASPALKHGLRSRIPSAEVLDPVLDEVERDLAAKVPDRDASGDVPLWNREMLWSLAVAKLQVIRCARFLAQHGEVDERGRFRPENDGLRKANESYQRSLERMAMTVPSRARTGADIARGLDPATALSAAAREPDPELRRALLVRADLIDGEEVADG